MAGCRCCTLSIARRSSYACSGEDTGWPPTRGMPFASVSDAGAGPSGGSGEGPGRGVYAGAGRAGGVSPLRKRAPTARRDVHCVGVGSPVLVLSPGGCVEGGAPLAGLAGVGVAPPGDCGARSGGVQWGVHACPSRTKAPICRTRAIYPSSQPHLRWGPRNEAQELPLLRGREARQESWRQVVLRRAVQRIARARTLRLHDSRVLRAQEGPVSPVALSRSMCRQGAVGSPRLQSKKAPAPRRRYRWEGNRPEPRGPPPKRPRRVPELPPSRHADTAGLPSMRPT